MYTDNDHIHPQLRSKDFAPLFNGVFPAEMTANIGRRCMYLAPSCLIEHKRFTVQTVQRNWRGEFCYRVIFDGDTFGRVALPSEIRFL